MPFKWADYMHYICEDCGADLDEDDICVNRWSEWTEAGPMPCSSLHCGFCGSEAIAEAHPCNNDKCVHYARDGAMLCDECYKALAKKFVAFMDSLTPCEKEQLNEWMEGEYPDETAERLKKGGLTDA